MKLKKDLKNIFENKDSNAEEIMTSEEAVAKCVMGLLDTKNFKTLTDIDSNEGIVLTSLQVLGEELDDNLLKDIVLNFCLFRVSRDRLGRMEIKDIGQSAKEEKQEMSKLKSLFTLGGRL